MSRRALLTSGEFIDILLEVAISVIASVKRAGSRMPYMTLKHDDPEYSW